MAVSQQTLDIRARNAERRVRLVAMYTAGATLQQCGDVFGITRERVRQILTKAGVTKADGGQSAKAEQKRRAYRSGVDRRREARAQRMYGASFNACIEANDGRELRHRGSLAEAYRLHRHNALGRGIGWEFSFPEWVAVWVASGHLSERGRAKHSFVMARMGDNGPYAAWNVHIITLAENGREYQNVTRIIRGTKNKQRLTNGSKSGFRGVWKNGRFFYASCGNRHLGRFPTAEQAAHAYDAEAVARYGDGAILNFPTAAVAA